MKTVYENSFQFKSLAIEQCLKMGQEASFHVTRDVSSHNHITIPHAMEHNLNS